ncbi:MAG: ABC-type transport auxiliary lipoprotein family protein [Desulfatiglandales bacterium]
MIRFFARPRAMWTVLLFFFLLASCATMKQPSLRIEHYTLEYAPPEHPERPPLPVVVKIQRFRVAPSYDTLQMVYRDRSFKRSTYTYHRWRAHPGDLVSDYLARDMRHSGLFRAVVQDESAIAPTHVLEGSLDEFFEWNDEQGWKAVLSLTATLIRAGESDISRKILFQKAFRTLQPCREKTPNGLVEAMSEAMARLSKEIAETLHEHLSPVGGE